MYSDFDDKCANFVWCSGRKLSEHVFRIGCSLTPHCYYKHMSMNRNRCEANLTMMKSSIVHTVVSPVSVQLLGFVSSQSVSVGAAPGPSEQNQNPGFPKHVYM